MECIDGKALNTSCLGKHGLVCKEREYFSSEINACSPTPTFSLVAKLKSGNCEDIGKVINNPDTCAQYNVGNVKTFEETTQNIAGFVLGTDYIRVDYSIEECKHVC